MMALKNYLVVLPLLLVISCTKPAAPIEFTTAPVEVSITPPPAPEPIVLNNITWKVINIDNTVYYGLRVSDYELLAVDMLEIKRYISAQKNIINYYEQITNN